MYENKPASYGMTSYASQTNKITNTVTNVPKYHYHYFRHQILMQVPFYITSLLFVLCTNKISCKHDASRITFRLTLAN